MKKLFAILAFLFAGSLYGQVSNPSIVPVSSTPSSCPTTLPLQIVANTSNVYGTDGSGGCTAIGGGGSMTWPASAGYALYSGANSWLTPHLTDNSTNVTSSEPFSVPSIGVGIAPSGSPLNIGSGSNSYFNFIAPSGTYVAGFLFRPAGSGGGGLITMSGGGYTLGVSTSNSIQLGDSAGGFNATLQILSAAGVNNFAMSNATTGNSPTIAAQGSDTNINIALNPKGTGSVAVGTSIKYSLLYSAAGTALPSCASGTNGVTAAVSDATAPTYMGPYVSGGTITTAVICSFNGTTYAWLTH